MCMSLLVISYRLHTRYQLYWQFGAIEMSKKKTDQHLIIYLIILIWIALVSNSFPDIFTLAARIE
jgi:hypothetical protein